MIKPLNSISSVAFTNSLDNFKEDIKNKKEPTYGVVLSPGTDNNPAPRRTLKQRFAGIFKGFNNVSGIATGALKGTARGIAFGCLAGVLAKNFKDATTKTVNELGKTVRKTELTKFFKGTFEDLFNFVGKTFKAIPSIFSKAPTESLKDIKDLPKKYMDYLGKGNKAVKAIAIGTAALTLGYNIIKSKVQANRKNANIDHSWNLGHQS